MNNGKYNTENFKKLQQERLDRQYGKIEVHEKNCEACKSIFYWKGRINTKYFLDARFCSKSCSCSVGGKAKKAKYEKQPNCYRKIAFNVHEKKCIICGHDKIVAIHHYDHDKNNNDPKNLVPLCPNHHEMYHSKKWIHEVKDYIDNWVKSLYK